MLMIAIAFVVICLAVSTKESRAAGRIIIRPYARVIGAIGALLWVFIIAGIWIKP